MPTTFATLFGSSLHGVKIIWSNNPAATGDRILSIDFTINMYAAKFSCGLE